MLTRFVVFVVLCHQNFLISDGKKIVCDVKDSSCLTEAMRRRYGPMVIGDSDTVPSSDPLHVDDFEVNEGVIKFKGKNSNLYGMKDCIPEFVEVQVKDTQIGYQFNIACKYLKIEGEYEGKGEINSMFFEGSGNYKAEMHDYVFLLSGELFKIFDKDNKLHYQNKYVNVVTEPRGKVTYDFKNLVKDDEEKSNAANAHLNQNWKIIDKSIVFPCMRLMMEKFISNVNAYYKIMPAEKALYYDE